jgi:hypothetical protein
MKRYPRLILPLLLFISLQSHSQNFLITPPVIKFDGNLLSISYDIINKDKTDQFYVWVEIDKKNGERIKAESLSGDIGEKIRCGTGKDIIWVPANDSVFLDEEISVEVKAEKYVRSMKKGSAVLMSALLPGLGQARISEGKPWWLTGIIAYGAVAGGVIEYSSALKTYDTYKASADITERADLYDKVSRQKGVSQTLIISGAVLWAANLIWVSVMPPKYKPLQHTQITLGQSHVGDSHSALLTLRVNF